MEPAGPAGSSSSMVPSSTATRHARLAKSLLTEAMLEVSSVSPIVARVRSGVVRASETCSGSGQPASTSAGSDSTSLVS